MPSMCSLNWCLSTTSSNIRSSVQFNSASCLIVYGKYFSVSWWAVAGGQVRGGPLFSYFSCLLWLKNLLTATKCEWTSRSKGKDADQYFWARVSIRWKSIPPQLGALHATLGSRWVFHTFFFLFLFPPTSLVTGCSEWPGNQWETSCLLLLLFLLASLKNIHWDASAVGRWAAAWRQNLGHIVPSIAVSCWNLYITYVTASADLIPTNKPNLFFFPLPVWIRFQLRQLMQQVGESMKM